MTRPNSGLPTVARTPLNGHPVGYRPLPGFAAADETAPISGGPIGVARPEETADAVHRDVRYRQLRRRQRRFVFVATPLFLAWYGLFVGLSAFAPSLMRTPMIGSVNAGMLLGLAQFVTTLLIVALYRTFARRELDPRVRELREDYANPNRNRLRDGHTQSWRMR